MNPECMIKKSKSKRNIGDEILQGLNEALDYVRSKEVNCVVHKVYIPNKPKIPQCKTMKAISKKS